MARNNDFISIKDALGEMLQENNLQNGITVVEVKEAWQKVMGEGVITYTKEVNFKNGTIVVKLTSATLREELSYGKDKIVNMLNEYLNKQVINNIKLT